MTKSVLITGAASGLGQALARMLHGQGYRLALLDCNRDDLEVLAAELCVPAPLIEVVDVADRAALTTGVRRLSFALGPIDLLVNNVGVMLVDTADKVDMNDHDWVMAVNFGATVTITRLLLPAMLERGRGKILCISSVFGLVGAPAQSVYVASKFAIRGYAEALRYELDGSGVTIHVAHPGAIDTNLVRGGRARHGVGGQAVTTEIMQKHFERMNRQTPRRAAETILDGLDRDRFEIVAGQDARWAKFLRYTCPPLWWWLSSAFYRKIARRRARKTAS